MHHLGAIDEGEFGERQDAVLVERGLEGEVEAGERLDRRQASEQQRGLDPAVLPNGELLDQDLVQRADGLASLLWRAVL